MGRRLKFKKKFNWGDILLAVFIVLLLIPQTGKPIQVGVNKLKILVWSPRIENRTERINVPAFDYALRNLEGKKVIERIGDGSVTFLSFWATWCAPCVAELPSIEALYQDYGEEVNFVLVTSENPEVVQRFLSKKGWEVPIFFPHSEVPEALQSSSIPTNYLIDAKGSIVIKEKGAADWNSKKVRELLDDLSH